jgi:hypothetical protein
MVNTRHFEIRSSARNAPWIMLFSRVLLFFFIQSILTLGFTLSMAQSPWEQSANWWPLVVAAANGICILLLVNVFRHEGRRYWDLFKIQRGHVWRDILLVLGSFIIGGPLSVFPNILLGRLLFGDPNATLVLFVRPLPLWAAYASIILFPVTQGLSELATYFCYVMPGFKRQGMNTFLAISLPALMLGLQHIAVPFLPDIRFILWRGLMFIPFAFFSAILLYWRPRFLPYMAIIHVLMNMSFAVSFLSVAY